MTNETTHPDEVETQSSPEQPAEPSTEQSHDKSETANDSRREAIIFVPGLAQHQSVDDIASRMATALNLNAENATASFELRDSKSEDFGQSKLKTRRVSIVRRKDGEAKDIEAELDVFGFEYSDTLTGDIKQRNLLVQASFALMAMLIMVPKTWRVLKPTNGKPIRDRLQTMFAIGWSASLICIYIGILLVAILTAVASALSGNNGATDKQKVSTAGANAAGNNDDNANPAVSDGNTAQRQNGDNSDDGSGAVDEPLPDEDTSGKNSKANNGKQEPANEDTEGVWGWCKAAGGWLKAAWDRLVESSKTLIVILAALGIFVSKWKNRIIQAAIETISVNFYLSTGYRKAATQGQLESLLEHVIERQGENPYGRIHIMCYSFGSTIALDTLFPHDGDPAKRIRMVNTLVTIGCPYNMIESLWPDYFQGRKPQGFQPQLWINVYSPFDALGSNFKDTNNTPMGFLKKEQQQKQQQRIEPSQQIIYGGGNEGARTSIWGTLFLRGLHAHTEYLGTKLEDDKDCFSAVLPRMFDTKHPLMR